MRARLLVVATLLLALSSCTALIDIFKQQSLKPVAAQRDWGPYMDDTAREAAAFLALRSHSTLLQQSNLVLASAGDVTLLAGQVPSGTARMLAAQITAGVPGAQDIRNELAVALDQNLAQRSRDDWLATRIRSELLFSNGMGYEDVKVATESGTVYLLGSPGDEKAAAAARVAATTSGVQRVVELFRTPLP